MHLSWVIAVMDALVLVLVLFVILIVVSESIV
jgi:hypothetical protein